MRLSNRRVPLSIFVSIVVASGAAGYVASTMQGAGSTADAPQLPRSALSSAEPAPTVVESVGVAETAVPARLPPAPVAPTLALSPAPEPEPVAEPVHVAAVQEFDAKTSEPAASPLPATEPVAAVKTPPRRTTASRPQRPAADLRRPQRVAQQRAIAPPAPAKGLKAIPLIGPVFSLLQ
jgi:hypothetical protein